MSADLDIEYRTWPICNSAFKHGLRCMDCNRVIYLGQPYGRSLDSFASSGEPIYELKCVYCADGLDGNILPKTITITQGM